MEQSLLRILLCSHFDSTINVFRISIKQLSWTFFSNGIFFCLRYLRMISCEVLNELLLSNWGKLKCLKSFVRATSKGQLEVLLWFESLKFLPNCFPNLIDYFLLQSQWITSALKQVQCSIRAIYLFFYEPVINTTLSHGQYFNTSDHEMPISTTPNNARISRHLKKKFLFMSK